jgi:hypothetical protein
MIKNAITILLIAILGSGIIALNRPGFAGGSNS